MITKNRIKFIRSLHRKKERITNNKFIIEGEKVVDAFLNMGLSADTIYFTNNYLNSHLNINGEQVSNKEMGMISTMKTPPGILLISEFIQWQKPDFNSGKYIVLDRINDPGNLGTIIRIADWFGINGIVCSNDSVDLYNAKTIQASMGSLFNVPVFYEDIEVFLSALAKKTTIIGADMKGASLSAFKFPENGLLIMGSESHGINPKLESMIVQKVNIPKIGNAESLNVAVATGILINKFAGGGK